MEYDAVVYDLDGTLVELTVDWAVVANDVAGVLREQGVDPGTEGLWGMLERADETGHREAVEATITDYERTGARDSRRLALADGLPHTVPVGVCSLNAEVACRPALAVHGIEDTVRSVVGRDTLAARLVHVASAVVIDAMATIGAPTRMVVTNVTCITHPKSTPAGSVCSTAGTVRNTCRWSMGIPVCRRPGVISPAVANRGL